MNTEKLPVQESIDDLRNIVVSEDDRSTLAAWQKEIDDERNEAVGSMAPAPELHQNPDGSIVTAEEHRRSIEDGENPSGPYDGGPRA